MGITVERHTELHISEGVEHFWEDHHRVNIEYAKYVGFALLILGIVGVPYVGEHFLFFNLTALQCVGHISTGILLLAFVMIYDGSYARLGVQVVGSISMIIGAYGLSGMTPVTALFDMGMAESVFYLIFGLLTALVGWTTDLSRLKHWWP